MTELNIEQERRDFCASIRIAQPQWKLLDDKRLMYKYGSGFYFWLLAKRAAMGSAEPVDPMPNCPNCAGSGEEEVMDGNGLDAHPIMVDCTHCGGVGSLLSAYTNMVTKLAVAENKYLGARSGLHFCDPNASAPPEPVCAGPDWSNSKTPESSCWKSPFHPMAERLQMADGAVHFRDEVIANLRQQLASAPPTPVIAEPVFVGRVFVDQLTGARSAVLNKDAQKLPDMACLYTAPPSADAKDAALDEVIGCFHAAEAEGLIEAIAETTDERLKDLLNRRIMHAYAAAIAAREAK